MSARSQLAMCQHAITQRHTNDALYFEVKLGSTWLNSGSIQRVDAVAIKKSWSSPCITIYEIKVSRGDFLRDSKWTSYLPFCHRFYFACPEGMIKLEELPEGAGLIYCSGKGARIKKNIPHSNVETMPWEMLYYLILSRVEDDHSILSNRQAQVFEAEQLLRTGGIESKGTFKELAASVSPRLRRALRDVELQKEEVGRWREDITRSNERIKQLNDVLRPAGIRLDMNNYGFTHGISLLQKLVTGHLASGNVEKLRQAHEELGRIIEQVSSQDTVECDQELELVSGP